MTDNTLEENVLGGTNISGGVVAPDVPNKKGTPGLITTHNVCGGKGWGGRKNQSCLNFSFWPQTNNAIPSNSLESFLATKNLQNHLQGEKGVKQKT